MSKCVNCGQWSVTCNCGYDDIIDYTKKTEVDETWVLTMELRFENRIVNDFTSAIVGATHNKKKIQVLQQKFISNLGNVEWRDIRSVNKV